MKDNFSMYGKRDHEGAITATTIHEAVEQLLNDIPEDEWPLSIEICAFVPVKVDCDQVSSPLESVLGQLDEEFGDPEDPEWFSVTEAMKKAEWVFIQAVLKDYTPWLCEVVDSEWINVRDHLG